LIKNFLGRSVGMIPSIGRKNSTMEINQVTGGLSPDETLLELPM
jgi:hypothetical protein